ncbi:hypothetical protein HYALB_00005179 [Hymenoscyphus albidus]|uniref:Uncharacterized protein n=1 Tax=Hymenoscyphus albidus TaxID=595503 RepID=A0A9N9LWR8_9HELO|nr:hypothetical protein HYALB_00005179 [Hymenoscyphus albidus]
MASSNSRQSKSAPSKPRSSNSRRSTTKSRDIDSMLTPPSRFEELREQELILARRLRTNREIIRHTTWNNVIQQIKSDRAIQGEDGEKTDDTVTRHKKPVQFFNFRPFDTAIACHKLAVANGGTFLPVHVVDPRGIPSPLAPGIHPPSLPKIKERCDAFGRIYRDGASNPEVWLSWKRAYDLWNNYYIEGRVNAEWLKEQLEWVKTQRGGPKRRRYLGPPQATKDMKVYEEGRVCLEHELPIPMEGTKWVRSAEPPQMREVEYGKEQRPTGRKTKKKRQKIIMNEQATKMAPSFDYPVERVIFEREHPLPRKGGVEDTGVRITKLKYEKTARQPIEIKTPEGKLVTIFAPWVEEQPDPDRGPEVEWEEYEVDEMEEVPVKRQALVPVWELVDEIPDVPPTVGDEEEADKDMWPTEFPDYDESVNGGFEALKKYDDDRKLEERTNNTVWRPRRIGETKDEINAIDEQRNRASMEENIDNSFRAMTEFEVDGGVDCAVEPFPALRWVDIYVRHKRGVFRKRRIWDRVTGTVFNLPTEPLSMDADVDLDKRKPPPRNHATDIFPLDIRRVRVHDPNAAPEPPLTNDDEEEVQIEGLEALQTVRSMEPDDPWWVTDEQMMLRDMPPRRWPMAKGHGRDGELLPWDDWDWRQHREYDEKGLYRYFATNLQRGCLRINGVEVKEGQVVGPLPEFAIIECPGGQIAFWHGRKGRMYGDEGALDLNEQLKQWEILRQQTVWKYAGMSAGEVWLEKIIDRLKREEAGSEGEDDDDFWNGIKAWEKSDSLPEDTPFQTVGKIKPGRDYDITTALSNPRRPVDKDNQDVTKPIEIDDNPLPDNERLRVPYVFPSPDDELKHLAITNVEFGKKIREILRDPTRQPQGEAFWLGTAIPRNFPRKGTVRSKVIEEGWRKSRDDIIRTQKEYVRIMRIELESKKRTFSEDSSAQNEASKRRRLEDGKSAPVSRPEWMDELVAISDEQRRQRDRLKEDDKVERLMQKNPNLMKNDLVRQLRKEKKREADELEELRKEENRKRRKSKQPEIDAARPYVAALLESMPKATPTPRRSSAEKMASRTPKPVKTPIIAEVPELPRTIQPTKTQSATKPAGRKVVDANDGQEVNKSPSKKSPPKQPVPVPTSPTKQARPGQKSPTKQPAPTQRSPPKKPVPTPKSPTKKKPKINITKLPPTARPLSSGKKVTTRINRRYPANLLPIKLKQFQEWDKIFETEGALGEVWQTALAADRTLSTWYIEYTKYHEPEKMGFPTETNFRNGLRSNFNARAQAAGLKPDEFAQSEGYKSIEDWINKEVGQQNNPVTSGLYPNLDGGIYMTPGSITAPRRGSKATKQNTTTRAMADRAVEIGLEAEARLAGESVEEYLNDIGKTREQYSAPALGGLVDVQDSQDRETKDKTYKDNIEWILAAQNFEQQVEFLEESPLPDPKSENGRIYAEI